MVSPGAFAPGPRPARIPDLPRRLRVGVDTGGTFTDFVFQDTVSGALSILKVPSTPDRPSKAVTSGLATLADPSVVCYLCHGTTVGTNALLEEKGARTGLLVTDGFSGLYEIMEQARPYGAALFDVGYKKPTPLAPPLLTRQVHERVGSDGVVISPLDEPQLRRELSELARLGVESLAVCLLFSFLHPSHEQRVSELAHEVSPGMVVSLSSDVLAEIREYYRLSTTVVSAYLRPVISDYLSQLETEFARFGISTRSSYVMQSNGGMTGFAAASRQAASTILSGPAGGVVAASELGRRCGEANIVTFDMGGTSCDVALIENGMPGTSTRSVVGGRHVGLPMLDVVTVGAGGGTLARVDSNGLLEVGPQSAGADPGPACYGKGGTHPTVTDANLVLGYLGGDARLGGELTVDPDGARAVLARLGAEIGLDPLRVAYGVVKIVEARMEEAIRGISTGRGYDIRDFVLLAYGGAGPLHAAAMLEVLGLRAVVVPPHPGVFSAMGLLMSEIRRDYARSKLTALDALDSREALALFNDLEARGRLDFADAGVPVGDVRVDLSADLRYQGQGYEVNVAVDVEEVEGGAWDVIRKRFDERHNEQFGNQAPGEAVEMVTYRAVARAAVPSVELPRKVPQGRLLRDAVVCQSEAYFGHGFVACTVYRRDALEAGHRFVGPAVITQMDATTLVRPGQCAHVDEWLNLVIEPRTAS